MHDNFDSAFDELMEKGFVDYIGKRPGGKAEYRLEFIDFLKENTPEKIKKRWEALRPEEQEVSSSGSSIPSPCVYLVILVSPSPSSSFVPSSPSTFFSILLPKGSYVKVTVLVLLSSYLITFIKRFS